MKVSFLVVGVCEDCGEETEIFSAGFTVGDSESLVEAEDRIDDEIGEGVSLACANCEDGTIVFVRTYVAGTLVEELSVDEFNRKYSPLGQGKIQ
jgi:ribosomal protein S27E